MSERARKIAFRIWRATEKASMALANAPYTTYTPPPKKFKREMIAKYEAIVRDALKEVPRGD